MQKAMPQKKMVMADTMAVPMQCRSLTLPYSHMHLSCELLSSSNEPF